MRARHAPFVFAVAALAACAVVAAGGLTGRVVDPDGKPVAGAGVCVVVGGAPGLCGESGPDGYYALPGDSAAAVRIVAKGYLPRTVAAGHGPAPIALERAASLRIRVVDAATGTSPAGGEADLVYSTGRRLGPFPFNEAGLSLPTLPAGDATVVVRCPGYAEGKSAVVPLVGGRRSETRVSIARSPVKGR